MSTIICARFHFFLTQRFRSSKLNKKETYEQSMDELDLQTLSAWAEDMYDFVMTIITQNLVLDKFPNIHRLAPFISVN